MTSTNGPRLRASMFGSANQFAQTPPDVLKQIQDMYNEGHPMYDPCPANPQTCGLANPRWDGDCCYCNPPYKNVEVWLKKCIEQCKLNKTIVCLIPFRSNTNWLHDNLLNESHCHEIALIRQGVKFVNYKKKAPFALCLAIYRPTLRERLEVKSIDFYH